MSLFDKITEDLKKAMLNKEASKLEAIRAIKTALLLAKSEKGVNTEISAETEMSILQKLVKQRKESAAEFLAQNRKDLADKELNEVAVISEYLPKQLSSDELKVIVKQVITESGASSIKDMGKVIGMVNKKVTGQAEGKLVADIVKSMLS